MHILLIFFIVLITFGIINAPLNEGFTLKRSRPKGKVKVGTLVGTPGPLKDSMKDLNSIGGQLEADSQYDTVATDYIQS